MRFIESIRNGKPEWDVIERMLKSARATRCQGMLAVRDDRTSCRVFENAQYIVDVDFLDSGVVHLMLYLNGVYAPEMSPNGNHHWRYSDGTVGTWPTKTVKFLRNRRGEDGKLLGEWE